MARRARRRRTRSTTRRTPRSNKAVEACQKPATERGRRRREGRRVTSLPRLSDLNAIDVYCNQTSATVYRARHMSDGTRLRDSRTIETSVVRGRRAGRTVWASPRNAELVNLRRYGRVERGALAVFELVQRACPQACARSATGRDLLDLEPAALHVGGDRRNTSTKCATCHPGECGRLNVWSTCPNTIGWSHRRRRSAMTTCLGAGIPRPREGEGQLIPWSIVVLRLARRPRAQLQARWTSTRRLSHRCSRSFSRSTSSYSTVTPRALVLVA